MRAIVTVPPMARTLRHPRAEMEGLARIGTERSVGISMVSFRPRSYLIEMGLQRWLDMLTTQDQLEVGRTQLVESLERHRSRAGPANGDTCWATMTQRAIESTAQML